MTGLDAIAGVLHVRPGGRRPQALRSTRRPWAALLARGRPASELPALVGNLFSLCGHPHRQCAALALQAALGRPQASDLGGARDLQCATLRDHARQICLEWPDVLAAPPGRATILREADAALLACPLLRSRVPGRDDAGNLAWLEDLLGWPAADWLARWERQPEAWLGDWSSAAPGWLPRLLRDCQAVADVAGVPARALNVHASAHDLEQLGGLLRDSPAFATQPTWRGDCAETGTWARLHESAGAAPATPWRRLGARVAELVRLVLPDAPGRSGAGWLATGALALAPGEGLAWVEMARGLLVHHVRLDHASSGMVIDACNVLAPTEWNFHPDGAVAYALEALDATPTTNRRVAALMAAYDPCVRFEIETPSRAAEVSHA